MNHPPAGCWPNNLRLLSAGSENWRVAVWRNFGRGYSRDVNRGGSRSEISVIWNSLDVVEWLRSWIQIKMSLSCWNDPMMIWMVRFILFVTSLTVFWSPVINQDVYIDRWCLDSVLGSTNERFSRQAPKLRSSSLRTVEQAQEQYYNFWAEPKSKRLKAQYWWLGFEFCIFLFFSHQFCKKNIMFAKKFAKLYIWRRGGRRQGPTAVPHSGRRRTVL
jgi:hypothetical protein